MPFCKKGAGAKRPIGGRQCRCRVRQSARQHHIILLCLREDGAVVSVGRCFILQGSRWQGFLDKYSRLMRKIYRETAVPPDLADDRKPCVTFVPTNG